VAERNKTYAVRPGSVLETSDGDQWIEHGFGLGMDPWLWGIAYGGGRLVAVGERGARVSSLDGITWTTGTVGPLDPMGLWFPTVAYGAGVFLAMAGAAGNLAVTWLSTDGETWSPGGSIAELNPREVVFVE